MTRTIAVVIFPGFQLLDAAGTITAFEIAGRYAPQTYAIEVLAADAGEVASSSGVRMSAAALGEGPYDTVVIFDVADPTNSADNIIFNDEKGSYRVRWELHLEGGRWLIASGETLDKLSGGDLCGF